MAFPFDPTRPSARVAGVLNRTSISANPGRTARLRCPNQPGLTDRALGCRESGMHTEETEPIVLDSSCFETQPWQHDSCCGRRGVPILSNPAVQFNPVATRR